MRRVQISALVALVATLLAPEAALACSPLAQGWEVTEGFRHVFEMAPEGPLVLSVRERMPLSTAYEPTPLSELGVEAHVSRDGHGIDGETGLEPHPGEDRPRLTRLFWTPSQPLEPGRYQLQIETTAPQGPWFVSGGQYEVVVRPGHATERRTRRSDAPAGRARRRAPPLLLGPPARRPPLWRRPLPRGCQGCAPPPRSPRDAGTRTGGIRC